MSGKLLAPSRGGGGGGGGRGPDGGDSTTTASGGGRPSSLLSPSHYDDDASSIHNGGGSSRSDADTDSSDDSLQRSARTSRELRAHDRRRVLDEDDETARLVAQARRDASASGEPGVAGRRRRGDKRKSSGLLAALFSRSADDDDGTTKRANDGAKANRSAGSSFDDGNTGEEMRELGGGGGKKRRRANRRARRKAKKERLLAASTAAGGETGELMYEMEEGGLRSGSATGSSSEDSDSLDRRNLRDATDAGRVQRRRRLWGWVHVYAVVAVLFVGLAVAAWRMTVASRGTNNSDKSTYRPPSVVSNGSALFAPTTIIISLDGFRADFLNRGLTPRLNAFIREGVSPPYMLPAFPSVTFPNHYTLATGLHPESHGIVGNSFWDPDLREEFYYTDPARSLNPKWWGGEPFWVTAERAGVRTAIHMWPGSEAHIGGVEPAFLDKYNGREPLDRKVARILELLDRPGLEDASVAAGKTADSRPQLIAAYVPNVDGDGHLYGPNSTEIRATIAAADGLLNDVFDGLAARNLTSIVNVVVVSDHGMATTDTARTIQLDDLVPLAKVAHVDGWPLVGVRTTDPADVLRIYRDLVALKKSAAAALTAASFAPPGGGGGGPSLEEAQALAGNNIDVYLRDIDMPARYHFSANSRIAPLWIVPRAGWAIVRKKDFDVAEAKRKGTVYHPRGLHGYDHEHPLMRAIFVARGPAFPHAGGSRMEVFQNTEVYNILLESVGLEPRPNNGTLHLPLRPVGLHPPDGNVVDDSQDPPPPPTAAETTAQATNEYNTVAPTSSTSAVAQPSPEDASSSGASTTSPPAAVTVTPVDGPDGKAPVGGSEGNNGTDGGGDGDDGKGGGKKLGDHLSDLWDWIAGKVGGIWDKLTGSG